VLIKIYFSFNTKIWLKSPLATVSLKVAKLCFTNFPKCIKLNSKLKSACGNDMPITKLKQHVERISSLGSFKVELAANLETETFQIVG